MSSKDQNGNGSDRPRYNRGSSPGYNAVYTSHRWRKYRKWFLETVWILAPHFGLCAICKRRPAKIVDHKKPHKGDPVLLWDQNNHQGVCQPCHNAKTAAQDGGFGNPIKGNGNLPPIAATGAGGKEFSATAVGSVKIDKALEGVDELLKGL